MLFFRAIAGDITNACAIAQSGRLRALYEDRTMEEVNDETVGKQVENVVLCRPGLIKDAEVYANGEVLVALESNGNLLIRDRAKPENKIAVLPGLIERFALRPMVPELAVAARYSGSVDRYSLHGGQKVRRLSFAHPSAVAYSDDGTLLAAGSKHGNVLVWCLDEEGQPRQIVESRIANERIVKVHFGFHCLVALTASGRCYRVPFHFAVTPKVLVQAKAEPRLVAGDGTVFDWNCYAYAHHPTLSLEAFGGECGVLVSQHELFGVCGVKLTGLGRFIHKLTFCPRTHRLVAMGENGVQIWSIHNSVMNERWQVAGDLSKLGRAAATVKFLDESYTAPQAGLKPLAYAFVDNTPVVYWG